MLVRTSSLAVAFSVLLCGCVSFQRQELSPAETQLQLDARTLRDPGLGKFLAAYGQSHSEEWDLARLTLAAFYFNPDLDLARAQFAEATAGVRTAAALPNPTVNFSPGYDKDAFPGVTPWILGYALNLPVELAGKRRFRTAEAQHQAEAAQLRLTANAWAIRSAVRQALIDLHAAEDAAILWSSEKPLLAQIATLLEAQTQAGELSVFEAAQPRMAAHRAELAQRESQRAVAAARSRLAEAIGIPFSALANERVSYHGLDARLPTIAPAEMRQWAAQNRADLLTALAEYAAAQSALQGEVARQYPDLALGPGYTLDQGEGKWSLSLSLTLPVFNRNQGPIVAAKARREAAAARFIALQNHALANVDRATSDLSFATENLETVKAMRASIEQQTKTVRAQQAAGEISKLELARAQMELADNSRAEIETRTQVERALSALEEAIQRPLEWPESTWRTAPRSTPQ